MEYLHIDLIFSGLVQENTQLTEEVRQLRLKLEEETRKFENRLHEAEVVNDELHICVERISDERNAVEEENRHKIEALEKQIKYDRQFLEVSKLCFCLNKFNSVYLFATEVK